MKKTIASEIQLPPQECFSIGEVAKLFNLTTRTLRFYEEMHLLQPQRRGARRVYSRGDCVRLKLILRGRRLNFTLDEIRKVIDLYHSIDDGHAAQIMLLLDILRDKQNALNIQEQEIQLMRADIRDVEKLCRNALKDIAKHNAPSKRKQKHA